jgi:Uma2 family endonuclease
MSTTSRLTVADLEGLPEGDGNRYELIEGELIVTTQPHMDHQLVADAVCEALRVWNRRAHAGGLALSAPGVIFDEDEALAPDVVWVSGGRLAALRGDDGKLHGAPDLVVEVLSPGAKNEKRDRTIKPARYAYWGVREYWLVDRFARQVEVRRLEADALRLVEALGEGDTLMSPMLPGFACAIADIFADLPPERAR